MATCSPSNQPLPPRYGKAPRTPGLGWMQTASAIERATMSMFSQLRSTLMLFAASLCLLVALAGGVGLYGTRLNHAHFDQLQTHRAVAEQITAINYKVFDSRLHIALALSDRTPERQRKEAEVIGKNLQNLRQSSQALAALTLPPDLAQPVQQFMAVVNAFSQAYLSPAQAAMQRGDAATLEHLLTSQEERFYTPIKQGREGIQRAQHTAALALAESATATERTAQQLGLVATIIYLKI